MWDDAVVDAQAAQPCRSPRTSRTGHVFRSQGRFVAIGRGLPITGSCGARYLARMLFMVRIPVAGLSFQRLTSQCHLVPERHPPTDVEGEASHVRYHVIVVVCCEMRPLFHGPLHTLLVRLPSAIRASHLRTDPYPLQLCFSGGHSSISLPPSVMDLFPGLVYIRFMAARLEMPGVLLTSRCVSLHVYTSRAHIELIEHIL